MRARDFCDGTTKFDFEFEPGCVGGIAKENMFRGVKWIQRAITAMKLGVGDRFSGSNDAGSAWLTCMRRRYDPELASYFRSRGFEPAAGALGGGTLFDENGAREMLKDLRKEVERLL
jgi:hypothetical protein